jgi:pimeloyl-ACP methyl ester carboxylesterase
VAETSYASCGDLSLAYQVFGDGPVELVFVAPTIGSHVELLWTLPEFQAFFERLAMFCRVVLFDQAGFGLSDPIPKIRLLEERAAEVEAVMDAVGFGKPAVFAVGQGGLASMVFAATQPERTRALILHGTTAYHGVTGWDDVERDPEEVRARVLPELGEDYTPSTEQFARLQEFCRAVHSGWGSGAAFRVGLPSFGSIRQLAMVERHVREPGDGAGGNRSVVPDRRAADPADDQRAHPASHHEKSVMPLCNPRGPRRPPDCRGRSRASWACTCEYLPIAHGLRCESKTWAVNLSFPFDSLESQSKFASLSVWRLVSLRRDPSRVSTAGHVGVANSTATTG